ALTVLSSDWYWEHDEAGRFTRVSEHANDESGVPAAAIIGKTRWETGIRYDPTERLALEQALEARRPFHDFSFSRSDGEGLLHYFTASGEPMFDPAGRYVGYRGV